MRRQATGIGRGPACDNTRRLTTPTRPEARLRRGAPEPPLSWRSARGCGTGACDGTRPTREMLMKRKPPSRQQSRTLKLSQALESPRQGQSSGDSAAGAGKIALSIGVSRGFGA